MRHVTQLNLPTRVAAGAVAALAVVALAACGDDGDDDAPDDAAGTTTTTEGGGDEPATGGTTIEAKDFELTSITVAPGAEVEVVNGDDVAHTVTSDDDEFDSGSVAGGTSATFTAPSEPGEHPFHCDIHPSMTGTLTVEG
jgi:plastocyanin